MSQPAPMRPWRIALSVITAVALIGLLLALGGRQVIEVLATSRLDFGLLAMLMVVIVTFCTAGRWAMLHKSVTSANSLAWRDYFQANAWGQVMALVFPAGVGEVAGRSMIATSASDERMDQSVYSSTLDLLFDLLFVVTFIIPNMLFMLGQQQLALTLAASLCLIGIVGAVAFYDRLAHWVGDAGVHLSKQVNSLELSLSILTRIQAMATKLLTSLSWFQHISARTALASLLLTMSKYGLLVARSWLVARAVGLDVPFDLLFFGIALIQFSQIIPTTPGGLGVIELGWYGLFSLAGFGSGVSVGFVLAQRIFITVATLLTALGSSAWLLIKRR